MKVECINDNWYLDHETGKSGITFKRGEVYDATNEDGRIVVINEQGSKHVIKTKKSLSEFFERHFRQLPQGHQSTESA